MQRSPPPERARQSCTCMHAIPVDGRPTQDPAVFQQFLPRIKAETDAVINITSGGSPHMTVEERLKPAHHFKPEVASLNMGSMNFGLYPMLDRFKEFKHDWERQHLANSRDLIFKNTFKDIEYILTSCGANGTRFEYECYDISHLYNLAHFVDRGLAKPPFFVQSVFGLLGGIGPHPEDLMHMRRTADRLVRQRLCLVDPRRRAATRFRLRRWAWRRARTCAWGLKIRCGSKRASWPNQALRRS